MEREQIQLESNDTDILLKSIGSDDSHTAPLPKSTDDVRQGWPALPRRVEKSFHKRLTDLAVDLVLFSCSVVFFAFALAVIKYDQAPVDSDDTPAQTLLSAAKYVSCIQKM
jgi:hypothetical protein